jgi:cell division protein FtsW (lipid II flippase)
MGCSGWCWPLIIYVIIVAISFISILISDRQEISKDSGLIWNIIWAVIFGVILWILCKNCYEGWAWLLLLLPIIIMLVIIAVYILGFSFGSGFKMGNLSFESKN